MVNLKQGVRLLGLLWLLSTAMVIVIIVLLASRSDAVCIGDATGDLRVGVADLNVVYDTYGQQGPDLAADFDRNGSVGAKDFWLLFNAWVVKNRCRGICSCGVSSADWEAWCGAAPQIRWEGGHVDEWPAEGCVEAEFVTPVMLYCGSHSQELVTDCGAG